MGLIDEKFSEEKAEIEEVLHNYWSYKNNLDKGKKELIEMIDKAIEDMKEYDKEHGTQYYKVIEKRFFEELGWQHVCMELNIEKGTVYNLEEKALNYILTFLLKHGWRVDKKAEVI
jgi:DNA-directed RNA polymerase specialized sigma subunit